MLVFVFIFPNHVLIEHVGVLLPYWFCVGFVVRIGLFWVLFRIIAWDIQYFIRIYLDLWNIQSWLNCSISSKYVKEIGKKIFDLEPLVWIAFVKWIVYSIGSCLVIVIFCICFAFLIENLTNRQSYTCTIVQTVFIPGKFVHLRKCSSRSVLQNITNNRLIGIPYPRPLVFPAKIEECIWSWKRGGKSNWESMLFWAGRTKLSPHNQSSFLTAQFFCSLSVSLHLYLFLWKKSTTGTISLLKGTVSRVLKGTPPVSTMPVCPIKKTI